MTRETADRLPDWLDRASVQSQNAVTDGVAHARRALERMPKPSGYCQHCDEPVVELHARFCDEHCLGGWERERKALQRNGRTE